VGDIASLKLILKKEANPLGKIDVASFSDCKLKTLMSES
jgi:hypothetical protein